jgi:flagellar basal-body rod modification protein FlgD
MSQISAFNPTDAALQSNVPSQFSKMSSEDFIKIIFTELSNQDPFQPNDSAALLEQLDSIRSIEADLKLTDQLHSLVFENQLASASSMIGKFIGGLTTDNQRVAGFVVSVIRQGDDVNLELDNGWVVPIGGVETVIDPDQLPEAPEAPAA